MDRDSKNRGNNEEVKVEVVPFVQVPFYEFLDMTELEGRVSATIEYLKTCNSYAEKDLVLNMLGCCVVPSDKGCE